MSISNLTDRTILESFRSGKEDEAFRLLIRAYRERLYWHIRRMVNSHEETDDVLQTVFIKAWTALSTFREDSGLFTWLYRIATNESLTHLKKANRYVHVDVLEAIDLTGDSDEPFDPSGDDIQQRFTEAIALLPDKQRAVFNMKYFDELTYEQISEILGTSVGALKASYHHASKKIELYLKSV